MDSHVVYVVPTHNRREDLRSTLVSVLDQEYESQEIVVVSDQSTDGTAEMFQPGSQFDKEEITYHHSEDHIGAPKARNIGVQLASGDIYVFLDDDTVLPDGFVTNAVVDAFAGLDDLGAIAFCIKNFDTGEIMSDEFPHRSRSPSTLNAFDTTYFIGAGCAIRSEALNQAGGFPESFDPNRFEEIDLAFRIINAGYRIRYVPSIVVLHKRSPKGRKPTKEALRYDFENRTKCAIRNLPCRFVFGSVLLWGIYTIIRARLDPRPLLHGITSLIESRRELLAERSVLDENALDYVRRHNGRLYY